MGIRELDNLTREITRTSRRLKQLQVDSNFYPVFNYNEFELILRVFKSVTPKIKSVVDRTTANSILNKTERFQE